jgi:hypothetical protein
MTVPLFVAFLILGGPMVHGNPAAIAPSSRDGLATLSSTCPCDASALIS